MYGKSCWWHEVPTCTKTLDDAVRLGFIEEVPLNLTGDLEELGKHDENLKVIETKLKATGQKAGLLWYSMKKTKHCVTVHVSSTGQMEIEDRNRNKYCITDLPRVQQFKLFVLKYDEGNGEPIIVKEWGPYCGAYLCKNERNKLATEGNKNKGRTPVVPDDLGSAEGHEVCFLKYLYEKYFLPLSFLFYIS